MYRLVWYGTKLDVNSEVNNGRGPVDYKIENPYDQFEQWLAKQPFWAQDATWRLYNKSPIVDSQIGLYVQMCLDQTQDKEVEFRHID